MQFKRDLQSFNRYSYVLNNALAADDPSGYFLRFAKGMSISQQISRLISSRKSQRAVKVVSAASVKGPKGLSSGSSLISRTPRTAVTVKTAPTISSRPQAGGGTTQGFVGLIGGNLQSQRPDVFIARSESIVGDNGMVGEQSETPVGDAIAGTAGLVGVAGALAGSPAATAAAVTALGLGLVGTGVKNHEENQSSDPTIPAVDDSTSPGPDDGTRGDPDDSTSPGPDDGTRGDDGGYGDSSGSGGDDSGDDGPGGPPGGAGIGGGGL